MMMIAARRCRYFLRGCDWRMLDSISSLELLDFTLVTIPAIINNDV